MRNDLDEAVEGWEMRQTVQMKAIGAIEYGDCLCVYLAASKEDRKLGSMHMARQDKFPVVCLRNLSVCDAVFVGRCERAEDTQTTIAQQLLVYGISDLSGELMKESTTRLHLGSRGCRERSTFTVAGSLGGLVTIPIVVVAGSCTDVPRLMP